MAADSLSSLESQLATVEAAITAAIAAPDFETSTNDGGKIRVQRAGQLAELKAQRLFLRRRIAALGGTLKSAPNVRPGIDVPSPAGNQDW